LSSNSAFKLTVRTLTRKPDSVARQLNLLALGRRQSMPWVDDGKFWVGRHESHGLVVVPKSSVSSNRASFDVYFVEQDRVAACNPEIMRRFTTGSGVSPDEANGALQAFLTVRNRELEEKNRSFLERNGKVFAGTRPRSQTLRSRVTHCFACREHLDSTINLECIACGWILCQCGACGCGYNPSYAP
jgi:hypothetical protein